MAMYNFKALKEAAKDAGIGEILPADSYDALADFTEAKKTQKGGDQISVLWKVLSGPHKGGSTWQNIVLPLMDEDGVPVNPKAVGPFVRNVTSLGVDLDSVDTPKEIADQILGVKRRITLAHREFNGNTYVDVKKAVPIDDVSSEDDEESY